MPAKRKTMLTHADPIPGRGGKKGGRVSRARAGTPDVRSAAATAEEVERLLRKEGFRMSGVERPHYIPEGYCVESVGGCSTVSVYYRLPLTGCPLHSGRSVNRRSRAMSRVKTWLRKRGYQVARGRDVCCIECEGP
jgi:hypothetical protein